MMRKILLQINHFIDKINKIHKLYTSITVKAKHFLYKHLTVLSKRFQYIEKIFPFISARTSFFICLQSVYNYPSPHRTYLIENQLSPY